MSIRSIRLYCQQPVITTRETVLWARFALALSFAVFWTRILFPEFDRNHAALSFLLFTVATVFLFRLADRLFPSKDA